MKKLMMIMIAVSLCIILNSCKNEPPEYKNVKVIPTVINSEPGEIWASDVYISPEDITEDTEIVYMKKGTKLGEWVAPVDGFYRYEQIKDYLKKE